MEERTGDDPFGPNPQGLGSRSRTQSFLDPLARAANTQVYV
jgi:hypothetical protein